MEDNPVLSLVLSWLPFLVLIGSYIVIVRLGQRPMIKLYEQVIAETKRTNTNLEKIAAALERANPKA